MTIYALPRITKKIKRIKRNLRLYFLSLWRHETFSYFISECSFVFILAACAPEHATVSPIKTQTTAASVNTVLNHQDWPKNEWWKAYNDPELNGLIAKALSDAPDMQIARQRITLAEAQAKAAMASDGPQIDFSADAERQKMSAEGLMGPFAITDPAAGTTGPWYTNGTLA